jgi:hypothetical protein
MIYNKDSEYVKVSDRFVYVESIYILLKNRAELFSEKFYKSSKPIKLKKKDLLKKTKKYTLYRFLDLVEAPLEYLVTNKFKKV